MVKGEPINALKLAATGHVFALRVVAAKLERGNG